MNNNKLKDAGFDIPANSDRWLVLLNPHAGCGKGKEDQQSIVGLLKKAGFSFDLATSDYPRHAISLTIEKIKQGYRRIIVAGGDGTLNEVVNGIFVQEYISPEEITIAMIPVGTGNDWVKTFGVPLDYKKAIEIIQKEKRIGQDVGKIKYEVEGEEKIRFFANIAGFGFDAMVADKANRLKEIGMKGFRIYLQSLLSSYFHYRTNKIKVSIGKEEFEDFIFTLSIGIGKFNGGGMMQTPFAVPNNGTFQVTVIRKIGLLGILRNIIRLYSGEFVKDRRVSTFETKDVVVNGGGTIMGEVDGEGLGNSSFRISMLDKKLQVIYGSDKYLNKENLAKYPKRKNIRSSLKKKAKKTT